MAPAVGADERTQRPRRSARDGPWTRVLATFALIVLCGAIAMSVGFALAMPRATVRTTRSSTGQVTQTIYRVNTGSREALPSTAVGSIALLLGCLYVWRPRTAPSTAVEGRPPRWKFSLAATATAALAVLVLLAGLNSHRLPLIPGDRRYLVGIVGALAGAVACFAWIPIVARLERRRASRPMIDRVACPVCGYDMKGLSTLRCPECGGVYTIEQLLAGRPPATTSSF